MSFFILLSFIVTPLSLENSPWVPRPHNQCDRFTNIVVSNHIFDCAEFLTFSLFIFTESRSSNYDMDSSTFVNADFSAALRSRRNCAEPNARSKRRKRRKRPRPPWRPSCRAQTDTSAAKNGGKRWRTRRTARNHCSWIWKRNAKRRKRLWVSSIHKFSLFRKPFSQP